MTEEDDLHAEIMGLEAQLAEATERNGNMAVELATVKLERNRIERDRDMAMLLVDHIRAELAAMTLERDALRREVDELAHVAESVPCYLCNAKDFCDNQPSATPCRETLRAWAKKQAAKAGKDVTP